MRMHFQKGLTYCLKCGKGFYRKAQLDRHMESHAGKFPCKQCGREFSSQAGRTIHLNSHKEKQTNSTEKFPCEECGKEFSTSIGRTVHLNIHNKHKQTINCPICDRVFKKNLSIYEDHLREHELATLFICPVCGHGFSSKVELTCHQKKHLEKMEGASSHVLSAVRGLVNQRR
ncbi:gastrula zinc finger protein XlCGF29.1-like [Saccostrea echinata]|uniref:gastrula zinc finger protein XlCGF29.1-like n=1 Tax=Saccostrea echinata TaxID=191078 RepID=UPI002A81B0E2|nr:gastrula zinc finger protein XlCGF29.1-like [Saccostrea echinata]